MKLYKAFLLCLLFISACHLFEGQVKVNTHSTVIYKGRGVSQKEAKRLGQFLLAQGYFNTFDDKTVLLRKKEQCFEITFLINKELFNSDKENLLPGYTIWQRWITEEVFTHTCTRIVIADEQQRSLHIIEAKAATH